MRRLHTVLSRPLDSMQRRTCIHIHNDKLIINISCTQTALHEVIPSFRCGLTRRSAENCYGNHEKWAAGKKQVPQEVSMKCESYCNHQRFLS